MPFREHLIDEADPDTKAHQAVDQGPVIGYAQLRVAQLVLDEGQSRMEERSLQRLSRKPRWELPHDSSRPIPSVPFELSVAELQMLLAHTFENMLSRARPQDVVVRERGDPRTTSTEEPGVRTRAPLDVPSLLTVFGVRTPRGQVDAAEPWVTHGGERFGHARWRTVSDNDDLDVLVRLREHGWQR